MAMPQQNGMIGRKLAIQQKKLKKKAVKSKIAGKSKASDALL